MKRILFLGEGSLDGPARYLAAILKHAKLPFDHLPDEARLPKAWQKRPYAAVVLSDYRYSSWTRQAKDWLIHSVREEGVGLFMIGGWASFSGSVGGYAETDLEKLLPVRCSRGDDRVNRTAVLIGGHEPPITVCGYHTCIPKPGSQTVLEFSDLNFHQGNPFLGARHPALVIGQAGRGRTAAFLSDNAPHWAGALVDWGKRRVQVPLSPKNIVETGDLYLRFFQRWIQWVGRYKPLNHS
jgi:uncharacterized membrane protein